MPKAKVASKGRKAAKELLKRHPVMVRFNDRDHEDLVRATEILAGLNGRLMSEAEVVNEAAMPRIREIIGQYGELHAEGATRS